MSGNKTNIKYVPQSEQPQNRYKSQSFTVNAPGYKEYAIITTKTIVIIINAVSKDVQFCLRISEIHTLYSSFVSPPQRMLVIKSRFSLMQHIPFLCVFGYHITLSQIIHVFFKGNCDFKTGLHIHVQTGLYLYSFKFQTNR
mgnify:CR=1 FL=1